MGAKIINTCLNILESVFENRYLIALCLIAGYLVGQLTG